MAGIAANPTYVRIMKQIYSDDYRARAMGCVRMEIAMAAVFASYLGKDKIFDRRWFLQLPRYAKEDE